jgi:tetratricopeptide (TPR) repeat protein
MTEPKYSPDIINSIIGAIGDYNTVTQNIIQQPGQPSPHRLPKDIADFTGRTDYIQEIEAVLQQGKIVAVNGMGGMGKSVLAIHVGHRLTPQFPDAQLYVDLRGQSEFPLEPEKALIEFLQALTGRDESQLPTDLDGLAGLYRSVLSKQKALIVLDNARDKLQIEQLLPGSASCGVMVTSRQPLGSLAGAQLLKLEAMSPEEGLDYLKQQLGLRRVDAERAAAQEMVELCGRLPLALAIAGGALKEEETWRLREYGARLRDEQRRLERLYLDELDLRASFNLSYARLAETEQQLFARAGCLPGVDFGEEVAAVVMEWETETTQETLRRLVRVRVLKGVEGRYQFHDLMRLFAREQLGATEQETTLGRALDWYCENADVWNDGLNPVECRQLAQKLAAESEDSPEQLEQALPRMALDWFEAEQGNWVAVMQQLQRLEHRDGAVVLAKKLVPFFSLRSHWEDWVTTHEIAIACAEKAGNWAGIAQTLNNLGNVYRKQGKWQEAISAYEQSLSTFRELGDVRSVAQTLGNLGNVYSDQGKWQEAISTYEQSLSTFRELGDVYGVALTLGNLGLVYSDQGKWQEAIAAYEQSLKIKRKLGDVHGVAQTLGNLGNVYRQQGNWQQAIASFEQSLQTFRELGDVHDVAQTLMNLGSVYLQQGRWQEAITAYEQCLQTFRELGDVHGVAQTLTNLGLVYANQGKWQEAIAFYEQSLQALRELGDVHSIAQTLGNLGGVYLQQGKWQKAITAFEQSLQTERQLGDTHGVAVNLMNLGSVYANQEKWQEAIAAYEQSLQISRELGDVHGEGQTLANLGLLYEKRHQPDQAKAHWQEALTKLNPSSPDFQEVQEWLTVLNQPQRPNFTRWLIPLGIAVFLVACLLKGQWLWALGGVVVVGAMWWGRGSRGS